MIKNFKIFEVKHERELSDAIIDNDYNEVVKLINNGVDLNKKIDGYTAPMCIILDFHTIPKYISDDKKVNWIENQNLILKAIINANPDLSVKSKGMTFWNLLNQDAYDFMKENFPCII